MPTREDRKPDATRKIDNYRLRYINDAFPLLSFTYAFMAGGEHTLYCDFSADYLDAYLGRARGEHVQRFKARLAQFEELAGRGADGKRLFVVHATPDDWRELMDCVLIELQGSREPEPIW